MRPERLSGDSRGCGTSFPSAEQTRIMRVLVGRVVVGPAGADIRLRVAGLATLVHELEAGAACVAAVLGSAVCSLGYALLPGGDGAPGLGTSRGRR